MVTGWPGDANSQPGFFFAPARCQFLCTPRGWAMRPHCTGAFNKNKQPRNFTRNFTRISLSDGTEIHMTTLGG